MYIFSLLTTILIQFSFVHMCMYYLYLDIPFPICLIRTFQKVFGSDRCMGHIQELIFCAGCTSICYCQSQHHSSAKIYPSSESGQIILIDNQSGLIDSLTTAKIQLVGPILPILEAETSQDRVFILSEQKNESLSPYQYQSDISIEDGLPLRLARLADFENVPCTTSESNGIRLTRQD